MTNIKNEVNEESAIQEDNDEQVESNDDGVMEISMDDLEALIGSEGGKINISELLETEMVRSRTLYLNEEVTLDTVNHIIQLIHKWNRDDAHLEDEDITPIVIYFDTTGGELYRGFSLVSAIENSRTPVVGIIEGGTCMSMGVPLFLSCDYRIISRHSTVLFHELRSGADVQTLREQQNIIRHYEHLQNKIDNYIVERTEVPMSLLKNKRKQNLDWYIDFEDLKKYKFAHEYV